MKPTGLAVAIAFSAALPLCAGDIKWQTDFGAALGQAKSTGKPVVILFGVGSNGGSC